MLLHTVNFIRCFQTCSRHLIHTRHGILQSLMAYAPVLQIIIICLRLSTAAKGMNMPSALLKGNDVELSKFNTTS